MQDNILLAKKKNSTLDFLPAFISIDISTTVYLIKILVAREIELKTHFIKYNILCMINVRIN